MHKIQTKIILFQFLLREKSQFTHHKRVAALHKFSIKITRQADKLVAEELEKQQRQNFKLYKFIGFLVVKSLLVFLYNPTKAFLVNRELQSLLPIDFVFVDQSELSGFLIANAIMVVMGIYLVLVSLYTVNFYSIIVNYSIQADLIEADVKQLDAFWSNTKTTSLSERHSFLRNICLKCQDKDK